MRRVLALVLGVLVASLSTEHATAGDASPRQQLATIERETQQIRGLKALHPVKAELLPDRQFQAAYSRVSRSHTPPGELTLAKKELVELGLVAPSASMQRIYFQNLGPQIGGLYDQYAHVLYVRNSGNAAFTINRWTVAHEFTHALQDQHFNLRKIMPDDYFVLYRNSDEISAVHDLTEGDAVVTQTLFIQREYTKQQYAALQRFEANLPKTPPIPKAIQREFNFPYTVGVDFVAALYRDGGMRAVDSAYRHLPNSSFVIMHPGAYLKGWRPIAVTLHRASGFSRWKVLDDDVFGAEGYNLLIHQWLPARAANAVTDEYRGDRYLYMERGSNHVMLFRSVWASAAAAEKAKETLLQALRARLGSVTVTARNGGELAGKARLYVYFRREGASLTMTYGPTGALAVELGTARTS